MYNSKPLNNEELKSFKERFTFSLLNNENNELFILWERKNSGKGCYTKLNNNTKIVLSNRNRKYTISSKAIKLWIHKYFNENLFDIQQAILVRDILSQNEEFIDSYLDNPNITIKLI